MVLDIDIQGVTLFVVDVHLFVSTTTVVVVPVLGIMFIGPGHQYVIPLA